MDVLELRKRFGDGSPEEVIKAVRSIEPSVVNIDQAQAWIWQLVQMLLDNDRYAAAAIVLWGQKLFDYRPRFVKTIIKEYLSQDLLLFQGASSCTKSYCAITLIMLDWLRDPRFTEAKIISATATHAQSNTFSNLQRFHKEAIIPLPGIAQDGFIGLDPKNKRTGISLLAIPKGDSGNGALQGFHPLPRPYAHPKFGMMSRIIVFMDEAIHIPIGVWRGITNLRASSSGNGTIRIAGAYNPTDIDSILAHEAEPPNGWGSVDATDDKEWKSRSGWKVVRLDAADCENVIFKKTIYEGLHTYENYERCRLINNGKSIEYQVFCRAMFPLEGVEQTLIPLSFMEGVHAQFIFHGRVSAVGAVDLAFQGDDEAIMFCGRYGKAVGYKPSDGSPIIMFERPRYCLQADQFFSLPKLKSQAQYEQIKQYCDQLGITPEWLALDSTGIGKGVADLLNENWSSSIKEINWGKSATDTKVSDESQDLASDIYMGIHSEMYGALRDWLEFEYIKFSPQIDTTKLYQEITGRRYKIAGKSRADKSMIQIEKKEEFKKRNARSPDRADALVMMLHCARVNGPERLMMNREKVKRNVVINNSITSGKKFINFNDE